MTENIEHKNIREIALEYVSYRELTEMVKSLQAEVHNLEKKNAYLEGCLSQVKSVMYGGVGLMTADQTNYGTGSEL